MRGVITATHFTEEDFNDDWPKGTVAAYQVRLDDGRMIYASVDSAACIRSPNPADWEEEEVFRALGGEIPDGEIATIQTLIAIAPALVLRAVNGRTRFGSALCMACWNGETGTCAESRAHASASCVRASRMLRIGASAQNLQRQGVVRVRANESLVPPSRTRKC